MTFDLKYFDFVGGNYFDLQLHEILRDRLDLRGHLYRRLLWRLLTLEVCQKKTLTMTVGEALTAPTALTRPQ